MRTIQEIDNEITQLKNQLDGVQGTPTEVYTRIVGYYRSVKNWNKGKREEYNYRKLFDIPLQMPTATAGYEPGEPAPTEQLAAEQRAASYTYFYRKNCPNCPPVKNFLHEIQLHGEHVDVDSPQGRKQAEENTVLGVPTVIFFDPDGQEIARANNITGLEELFAASATEPEVLVSAQQ
jgi:ribonucleoside-triphosphate reductase